MTRKSSTPDPAAWLSELQSAKRELPGGNDGWRDAETGKPGVVTIRIPGLPDDEGRVEWTDHHVTYCRGRNLNGYLRELHLETLQVLHVIVDGAVIRRSDVIRVEVPEKRFARTWRKFRGLPAPAIELVAFDAFIPRSGSIISIVPTVDGKNAALILGVVGGIIGGVIGFYIGGPFGIAQGATYGFKVGYGIGVAYTIVSALIAPTPNRIKDKDGPSSFQWDGIQNDDRAGVAVEILLGQRLVPGGRISSFRRRGYYIPPNRNPVDIPTPPQAETPSIDSQPTTVDASPATPSEKLSILIRICGHETEGPVGITNPNAPCDVTDPENPANPPDVRINGQHYRQFPGVSVAWRTGTDPQDVISGFDVVANTYTVNVDVTALGASVPYTYTTISPNVDAFEVLLSLPGLSHRTTSGIGTNKTRYTIEYKRHGTADPWVNIDGASPNARREIAGQTGNLKFETRRVSNLPRAQYDIRVTWLSADHVDITTDQWHIILSGITEETQEALSYPGNTVLAVTGIATEQLNGPQPTITSVWRGAKPQKWTSGGGFAAADWGVGSATPAGRNRGWLTLWLIRNKKLGVGEKLNDADIDLSFWKAFADKCDELETVTPLDTNGNPLGAPYTEPRFNLDLYINQQQAALDLVQQILGSARACNYTSGTKVRVGYNGPGTASQLFGMGNIAKADGKSSMQLQYRSQRHEINTLDVTFDDEAADFETETVTVCIKADGTFTDEAGLQAAGQTVKRQSLQLIGTRRRTEAVREGRFHLKNIYTIRTLGTFSASTDSMFAETYDIINVSHDLPQWGYSGRVMPNTNAPPSIIQSMVLFDRIIPFDGVTTYGVMIRYAAGDGAGHDVIEERIVADVAAPSDGSSFFGVTVTVPFSQIPQEGDIWAYGPVATKVKPFRILDISRDANMQRSVSIIEHNDSVHVTDGPIVIPVYSDLPNYGAPPPPITNATSSIEVKTSASGVEVRSIFIEWTRPTPSKQYGFFKGAKVEYGFTTAGPWTTLQSADGDSYRWDAAPVGIDIFFRLTPYSTAGRYNFAGAYVISTPVNLSANWKRNIVPQNPSAVTFSKDASPNANRRRVVRSGDNPGQATPQQVFDLFVNWVFSDVVNATGTLSGFRVIIYPFAGGDPNAPYWESALVNPNARSVGIPGLGVQAADTYIAAVEALYIDGNTSALATSTGLLLDPSSGEPLIQTSDDRNVAAYAETFDTAGVVPTGFTKAPSDSLSVTGSALVVDIGNLAATYVIWNLKPWSDAYLDTRRGGGGTGTGRGFSVELSLDARSIVFATSTPQFVVTFDDGIGGVETKVVNLIKENAAHIYKVAFDASVMPSSPSSVPTIKVDMSGVFGSLHSWAIRGIAIAFDDIAWNVDAHLDRAIRAREQFGKDPLGLGFFLQSPLRNTDDAGNVTIIDSNGQLYIRSGGTDTAVRRAFSSIISRSFNDAFFRWNLLADASHSNEGMDPAIPAPVATNKVRIAIEAVDRDILDVPPTGYPVRRYLEATEINAAGFRTSQRIFYGGTMSVFRELAPVGGWPHSVGASSDIVLGGSFAWYNFGVKPSPALVAGLVYYRTTGWIEVAMPLVKKANGSFYYATLDFTVLMGQSNDDDPMTLAITKRSIANLTMRVLTDGNVHRMPFILSGGSGSGDEALQFRDIKIAVNSVAVESGGSAPTTIRLMAVEMAYQNGGSWNASGGGQNYNVIYGEVA